MIPKRIERGTKVSSLLDLKNVAGSLWAIHILKASPKTKKMASFQWGERARKKTDEKSET